MISKIRSYFQQAERQQRRLFISNKSRKSNCQMQWLRKLPDQQERLLSVAKTPAYNRIRPSRGL